MFQGSGHTHALDRDLEKLHHELAVVPELRVPVTLVSRPGLRQAEGPGGTLNQPKTAKVDNTILAVVMQQSKRITQFTDFVLSRNLCRTLHGTEKSITLVSARIRLLRRFGRTVNSQLARCFRLSSR